MPQAAWTGSAAKGNSGPDPNSSGRQQMAAMAAATTGTKERGRHSNSSSSTASSTAATGVPKMPVMPAAAPATSSVLRSAALRSKNCAKSEPIAPPVMMMGPSAPKGPPVPIDTAEEIGFSTATLGDMRLPPIRMASMASGMPWPRIFSEPKRAMSPMTRPPTTGAPIVQAPRWMEPIGRGSVSKDSNQTTFVTKTMSFTSTQAAKAPPVPIAKAMPASMSRRGSALKSASRRSSKRAGAASSPGSAMMPLL